MSDVSSSHHSAAKDQQSWGPLLTFLFTGLIFILAQFFAAIILGITLAFVGEDKAVDTWLRSNTGQFTFVVIFEAITVGLVWLFLRLKRLGWRSIGFTRAPNLRDAGFVVLGFLAYFGLLILSSMVATQLFQVNGDQEQQTGFSEAFGAGQMLMIFVSLVVLPPIVEEILFRGFLFGGLRSKLTFWSAAIITSVSFGALHLLTGMEGEALLWIAGIDTFVLSLVLCYVREKTGALWACIGIHALKNSIAFLYLFVVQ